MEPTTKKSPEKLKKVVKLKSHSSKSACTPWRLKEDAFDHKKRKNVTAGKKPRAKVVEGLLLGSDEDINKISDEEMVQLCLSCLTSAKAKDKADQRKNEIKIEKQRAKDEKEAERKAEKERKAKEDAELKEEAERKKKAEEDLKAEEEADRKKKAEAELKAGEEAERIKKEEADRKKKAEAELKAREEAERIKKEEEDRKKKAEAELKAREEAERKEKEDVLDFGNGGDDGSLGADDAIDIVCGGGGISIDIVGGGDDSSGVDVGGGDGFHLDHVLNRGEDVLKTPKNKINTNNKEEEEEHKEEDGLLCGESDLDKAAEHGWRALKKATDGMAEGGQQHLATKKRIRSAIEERIDQRANNKKFKSPTVE